MCVCVLVCYILVRHWVYGWFDPDLVEVSWNGRQWWRVSHTVSSHALTHCQFKWQTELCCILTRTHTHTHTQRERERERERDTDVQNANAARNLRSPQIEGSLSCNDVVYFCIITRRCVIIWIRERCLCSFWCGVFNSPYCYSVVSLLCFAVGLM